jgi:hypothetical protein
VYTKALKDIPTNGSISKLTNTCDWKYHWREKETTKCRICTIGGGFENRGRICRRQLLDIQQSAEGPTVVLMYREDMFEISARCI